MNPGEMDFHNGMATLDRPLREEVDVALGRLMAVIEDASTAYAETWGVGSPREERNGVAAGLLESILTAKNGYDAARLSKGGEPLWEGAT